MPTKKALNILGFLFFLGFLAVIIWSFLVKPKTEERAVPSDAVKIAFPLKNGLYQIAQAGPAEGVHIIGIEKYALDIFKVFAQEDSFWKTLFSLKNGTFGTPVYSPCSGRVRDLHDGEIDHEIRLFAKKTYSKSNNITITCDGFNIYMAHFKKDSIKVKIDQIVSTDTQIGEIGNSGYTDGPHLHIHAFLEKNDQMVPVPMVLNERYLQKGDFISN